MSLELDGDFESDLREALLDDVERRFRDEIAPAMERVARQRWQAYAQRNDYDISHVWEDAEHTVTRDEGSVDVRIEWPELTALFEFGVGPHTIEGDPLLHFYWEKIDQWITTDSVEWGSETGGIPEARAVRDTMNEFRRRLDA